MKNKLINFSKNIFKGVKTGFKELLIVILILSIFLGMLFGGICSIGLIAMLITQTSNYTIENLMNFGMASISAMIFVVTFIWFVGSSVINFVKWIKDCWKESEMK